MVDYHQTISGYSIINLKIIHYFEIDASYAIIFEFIDVITFIEVVLEMIA